MIKSRNFEGLENKIYKQMKNIILLFLAFSALVGCSTTSKEEKQLALKIINNKNFSLVKEKAKDIISTGFT
ncbi:MAG: hypothetical protein GXO85_16460, partial [Chlorobi bacterium]|nr:hypothetical protein [Chlorobiota bacterium]